MASLTVLCPAPTPDWPGPHREDRTICLFGRREACKSCPNHNFDIRLQFQIPEQRVVCPRWDIEKDRIDGRPPIRYEQISRHTCLAVKPYPACEQCPNSKPWELPRSALGWWERERELRLKGAEDE